MGHFNKKDKFHNNNKGGPRKPETYVGIIIKKEGKLQLELCDKRRRFDHFFLNSSDLNNAIAGDIVVVERLAGTERPEVKVKRILGQKTTPGILSLISLYENGLHEEFSKAALKESESMTVPDLKGREDLRNIPLVTIDGPDSRDFDDAVFAEKTADGGYHLIVAIADVSWYVTPGSELDKEAYARGNSTYFPDRVVPMLPEELSNGLCSLKPHEDRACMSAHLYIDKDGNLTGYRVARGLMNSAARLTYPQVQAAKDGNPDAMTAPLMDKVINPLYAAYELLRAARKARGALDLEMPEYKVSVNNTGTTTNVDAASRPDSCKVIEEFMILANVAVPMALEEKNEPLIYRVHDKPPYQDDAANSPVDQLREYIKDFGLTLPEGELTSATDFKDLIEQAAKIPYGHLVVKAISCVQAKARYSTDNIGHFGLALPKYAHFTSPIRRYEDLEDHRSLVDAFNMGKGALDAAHKAKLSEIAEHISETEIASVKAERSAYARFAADFLSKHVGEEFTGRISGIANFGAFVKLDKADMDGLLPLKLLPKDFYQYIEDKHMLVGRERKLTYRQGAKIIVRIKEADGLTGSVLLEAANDNSADVLDQPMEFRKKPRASGNKNNKGPRR